MYYWLLGAVFVVAVGWHVRQLRTLLPRALQAYHAGRPKETARLAERFLRYKVKGKPRVLAHIAAGLGHGAQGRLDEAETHFRQGYGMASAEGLTAQAAEAQINVANTLRRRGQLRDAWQMCEQVLATFPEQSRFAYHLQATCLRYWGRAEEARERLKLARAAPGSRGPDQEKHAQALFAVALSWCEGHLKNMEAAWGYLKEAEEEARRDPKQRIRYEATAAWFCALEGRADEANRLFQQVAAQTPGFQQDNETSVVCCLLLARTAFLLEDYARSKTWSQACLALPLDPVDRPNALQFYGEACLQLGEREATRAAFQEAVTLNLETEATRRAAAKLAQMDAPSEASGL